MSDTIQAQVTSAIQGTLAEWLARGLAKDAAEINRGEARGGCCDDFANVALQGIDGLEGVQVVDVAMFMRPDPDELFEGNPFDRKLLKAHWPRVQPPEDLDWKDMNRLSRDAGFNTGTHVWITDGARHYDAECPEGTENFFALPFFQRVIASWVEERDMGAGPRP